MQAPAPPRLTFLFPMLTERLVRPSHVLGFVMFRLGMMDFGLVCPWFENSVCFPLFLSCFMPLDG